MIQHRADFRQLWMCPNADFMRDVVAHGQVNGSLKLVIQNNDTPQPELRQQVFFAIEPVLELRVAALGVGKRLLFIVQQKTRVSAGLDAGFWDFRVPLETSVWCGCRN